MNTVKLARWSLVLIGLVSLVTVAPSVRASPMRLDCRYVAFRSPVVGETVFGTVEIRGRALILDFQFYKVEYSPVGREDWMLIGTDVVRQPVENGRLALWQTTAVRDGDYRLRLRVVDPTGNYCEAFVSSVTVFNAHPTAIPTTTDTPIVDAVPPQPTPTAIVVVPVEFVPARGTPATLPPRSTPLPELDWRSAIVCFMLGGLLTFAVMVFVGIVLVIRKWA